MGRRQPLRLAARVAGTSAWCVSMWREVQKRLCHSTEGSDEIVEFFRLVVNGTAELHQRLHVKHDGTKVFFDEYHTTKQEACELICAELGI